VTTYGATLTGGVQVTIEQPYEHVGAPVLLEAIEQKTGRARRDVESIVRSPGRPDERTVYTRISHGGANPLVSMTRIFVSFVYEPAGSKAGTREYGSALLDMEYEPYEQLHLDHLAQQIAQHVESEKVIVLGWQKVQRN
jgi:hypothetical protein